MGGLEPSERLVSEPNRLIREFSASQKLLYFSVPLTADGHLFTYESFIPSFDKKVPEYTYTLRYENKHIKGKRHVSLSKL